MSYLVLRRTYSTGVEQARKFTQQHHLGKALQQLFPNHDVRENVRKEGSIQFPSTLNFLEIDFWIPDLHLAFEFQDIYHYKKEWNLVQKSLEYVTNRDDFKKAALIDRGETLLQIPYWWDGSLESLAATIKLHREDLLLSYPSGPPIPSQPLSTNPLKGNVPDVGELMLAAVPDTPILDPEKWWVSEKYDGIRGCWNPKTNTVYARSGGEIILPQFLINILPKDSLVDFEFWCGRGAFDEVAKAVYLAARMKPRELFDLTEEEKRDIEEKGRESVEWSFLRILVLDCPTKSVSSSPYEERLMHLLGAIDQAHPFAIFIPNMASKSRKHMEKTLEAVLQNGGEGIVLRKFNSIYCGGRSENLFKLKLTRDQEALLVSIDTKDNLYRVQFPEGHFVLAAIPPSMVTSGVKPGDILTVRVEVYKEHVPAQVVVMRVRRDMTWHDVLANTTKIHVPSANSDIAGIENLRALKEPDSRKPAGHWQIEDAANVRSLLDQFARKRGLDPLVPETWYNISSSEVYKEYGATFLHNYSRSYTRSLAALYPNIGLKLSRFKRKPASYWESLKNQRAFLDDYAARNGFDPLIAENWRDFSSRKLKKFAGSTLLTKWNHSPFQALRGVYPEVSFRASDFLYVPRRYWSSVENRRKAFDAFAESQGFDPLVVSNWYPIIANLYDGKSKSSLPITTVYRGSLQAALHDVYPNLSFVPLQFAHLRRNHWRNKENVRSFLLDVAAKHNFDPLLPQVWLSKYKTIMQEKHGPSLLSVFGSVARVIKFGFPEMDIASVATKVKIQKKKKNVSLQNVF